MLCEGLNLAVWLSLTTNQSISICSRQLFLMKSPNPNPVTMIIFFFSLLAKTWENNLIKPKTTCSDSLGLELGLWSCSNCWCLKRLKPIHCLASVNDETNLLTTCLTQWGSLNSQIFPLRIGSRIVFFPIFTRKKTISNANANFQMLYLYYLVLSQRDQNEHGNKIMRA